MYFEGIPLQDRNALLELTGSIWLGSNNEGWGSQRRMALLRAIDEEGSISAGARRIGLSYKAAWDAVDTMNNLAGEPLVERSTGGQGGGGARLTERARKLVRLYATLEQAHERFIAQLAGLAGQARPDLDLIRNLMIQTSARNKLLARIQAIEPGRHSDGVILVLGESTTLTAQVSRSSIEELALAAGEPILAFIDASAIMIGLAGPLPRLSARNQLDGRIVRIDSDDRGSEITLQLPEGHTLVSQVTSESLDQLELHEGRDVRAIFKASSVMLGRPA